MKNQEKGKPNFILTVSKEKLTPEQDRELLAEFVFMLINWQETEERQAIC